MKHLKKLSVVLLMTTLFSVSFTSCIDNEVSPVVEAIYQSQANLLEAQANLLDAEATLFEAQAAAEAMAAQDASAIAATIVAQNEAETAVYIAIQAQYLAEQVAATELAVERARIAMLLAQAEFDQDLAQIAAAIRIAANNEAYNHAVDYANAMTALNTLRGDRLTLQGEIAENQLFMQSFTEGSEMTWEVYLANLERDVLAKEASVAANEAYIARANAYFGDYDAMVAALDAATAAEAAKQAEIDVLLAEDNQIDADILAESGNFDMFISSFETMEGELETLQGNLATQEGIVETLTTVTIPAIETAIADYDGTTTTLTAAQTAALAVETAAQTVVDDAVAALGTVVMPAPLAGNDAIDPVTTSYEALWNAQLVVADANQALNDLNDALSFLNLSYQDAIQALADETALYESGLPGVTADLTAAQAAQTAAEAQLIIDQADYDAKKAAFEADPTGFVWTAGVDGVLGIQTSNAGVNDDSYIAVTVVAGAANDTYSAISTVLPAGLEINGGTLSTLNTYAMFANDGDGLLQADDATPYVLVSNDFWNVGSDDVFGGTNADRLEAAADVLTASLAAVDSAIQLVADKQLIVDNFGTALAAAQAVYDYQKDLYENQLALVAAAEAAVTAADAVELAAQTVVNDAEAALGTVVMPAAEAGDTAIVNATTFYELLWNAQLAALDATAALNLHLATTLATYEANLATEQANLVAANNMISEINILITRAEADIAALQAEYDALIATPLYAAQQVRILEIIDEIAVLTAEKAVLTAEKNALAITISFEGSTTITAIETAIDNAQAVIDGAQAYYELKAAQIAIGEFDVASIEAEIETQMARLADLEAQIAAKAEEAAGYKALLDAALAS